MAPKICQEPGWGRTIQMVASQAVLVYNPGSGKGLGKQRAEIFAEAWEGRRPEQPIRLRPTRSREDIRVAAKETAGESTTMPIFMGGDGTLSEGVQGLAEDNQFCPLERPVGLLPGGTGNSFLRDFGITDFEQGMEALFEALERNLNTEVDTAVIRYRSDRPGSSAGASEIRRIMFNFFGLGLIPNITDLAVRMRFLGPLNYRVATVVRVLGNHPCRFVLEVDGEREECLADLVTVSNSRYTGGDMEIAPAVRINDGRLFLAVTSAKSKPDLFRLFPRILKGNYEGEVAVQTRFAREIAFEFDESVMMNIDGELERGRNPRMELIPSFFRIAVCPDRISA